MPGEADLSSMSVAEKRALLARLLEREGERPAMAPLSFPQERLWFLDQLDPGTATYNIPATIPVAGRFDPDSLERALQEIVRRHESLRTTFSRRGDEPVQVIWPDRTVPLAVHDLRSWSPGRRRQEVDRIAVEEAFTPFDLGRGPLLRAVALRLAAEESLLLVTTHHIVSDGWSMNVFEQELAILYAAFAEGRPSPLPPLAVQYRDFAHRQREELQGEALEAHLQYWREQLAGAPALLAMPTDRRRPPTPSALGYVQPFSVPADVAARLLQLTKEEGATAFMTLLAAFKVFLSHHTGQTDLVVGAPVANRNRPDLEPLIGFFVNSLILRTDASGSPTFREFLRRVREVALGGYAHQELPFEKIVEDLQPERDLSRNPVFQVVFAYQTMGPSAEGDLAVPDDLPPSSTRSSKFDITLGMGEVGGGIGGALECSADLFEAETVSRLAKRFLALLAAVAEDPDRPIDRLASMRQEERATLLVGWNQTAADFPEACFHQLFEAQCDRTPEAVAVEGGDQVLTYAELDQRANRLAHRLRGLGAGPETRVAICVERGVDMAVAVLGVHKSGAAYVPVDPRAPAVRTEFILRDAEVTLVVAQPDLTGLFDGLAPSLVVLGHEELSTSTDLSSERLQVAVDPYNLAYLIYTSGSTGTPKGILVPHRGVANMGMAEVRDFGIEPTDRVLQVAPLIFDVSLWEMAMTWLSGATLVFATEEEIVSGSVIDQKQITAAAFTPSLLATLDAGSFPELAKVISVGEACTDRVVEEWAPGRRLLNAYGPTETTGHCTTIELLADGSALTVGRPIQNVRIYIVNEALEPVPTGVVGEIYVSSPGTTRGYAGRPGLTAECFVPDPFTAEPGGRLYKTGDLARYLADGRIEYLGRVDHQVKVRGFRIELGEIESVLATLPGVGEAVVMAREDRAGDKRLVAYVVGDDDGSPLDVEGLRHELRRALPAYMVPAHVVLLDRLPLSPNRKVDREALPAPDQVANRRDEAEAEPMTATEEAVARIWEDVLGTPVGRNDNFFDLGGHSLLGTQVLVRLLDTFQVEIPLRALFFGPTVEELAATIEEAVDRGPGEGTEAIQRIERRLQSVDSGPAAR